MHPPTLMTKTILNLSAIAALVLALFTPAYAQTPPAAQAGTHSTGTTLRPNWDASLGYQSLSEPDQTFPFGLNLAGARNFGAMGIAAEAGWSMDKDDDVTSNVLNFGAGPRWMARTQSRAWPFAQVMAGVVHSRSSLDVGGVDISSNSTKFMLQPGAGVVFLAGDGWGFVGQADYRRVFLDEVEDGESGRNDLRVFFGLHVVLD